MEALDLLHDARVGREPRVHVGARLRVALERLQHLEPARVAHRPDRVEREAVAVLVRVRVRFRVSVRVRVRVRVRVGVRVRLWLGVGLGLPWCGRGGTCAAPAR